MTPVGLLFAGSSTSTIANDIANVYSALGVTVATSAAAAPAEAFLAQAPPNPQQVRLEAIQERIQDRMLNLPGVVGMGIGSDGSGLVFRVFVSKRPAAAAIPAAIDGVKVVVEESGEFRAF